MSVFESINTTIPKLVGMDTSKAPNALEVYVLACADTGPGAYVLDKASTETADGLFVVAPTTGPGRWIRTPLGVQRMVPDVNDTVVFKMTETSGNFANSGSGGAIALIPGGAVQHAAAGSYTQSAFFYAGGFSDAYGQDITNGDPAPGSSITYGGWAKLRSFPPANTYARLFQKSYWPSAHGGGGANAWVAPFVSCSVELDGSTAVPGAWAVGIAVAGVLKNFITLTRTLDLGVWHYLALTADNTLLTMWMDGEPVGTTAIAGFADFTQGGSWMLGGNVYLAAEYADAYIDDVRLTNVQRSAAYIRAMYQKGTARF